jgi:hypothetical protein
VSLPVVTWPDVVPAVADALRAALAADVPGLGVGGRAPTSRAADRGGPWLQVSDDGSTETFAVVRLTIVRVTAWAADRDVAHRLADRAASHLAAITGAPVIRAVDPVSGPLDATDSTTGDALASVVVRVKTRPVGA